MHPEGTASMNEVRTSEILKKRAEKLRLILAEGGVENGIEILRFSLSESLFALPTESVTEVLRAGKWTVLPGTPAALIGIMMFRGRVIPVLDPSALLDIPPASIHTGSCLLLVGTAADPVCIPVDQVESVDLVDRSTLFAIPSTMSSIAARYMKGIFADGTALLDIDAILKDDSMIF